MLKIYNFFEILKCTFCTFFFTKNQGKIIFKAKTRSQEKPKRKWRARSHYFPSPYITYLFAYLLAYLFIFLLFLIVWKYSKDTIIFY